MLKIFLDCGANIGQGYLHFKQKYGDDYLYILFEPNPNCYEKLIDKFGKLPNVNIRNEAVYTENCTKIFKFSEELSVGGSIIDSHNSMHSVKNKQEIPVNCVNIIQIIEDLSLNHDIIIKFDIESSEYDILEKMIEFETIFKVNKIYCEFHSKYMDKKNKIIFRRRENKIIKFTKENDINFEIWH